MSPLPTRLGWATPARIARVIGAVRNRWPDLTITLHLHDTRGLGIACALEGLRLGVSRFDAAVAGLGVVSRLFRTFDQAAAAPVCASGW